MAFKAMMLDFGFAGVVSAGTLRLMF